MIHPLSGSGRRFGRFIPQPELFGNGVVCPRHRGSRRSSASGFELWDYQFHSGYAKETQHYLITGGRGILEKILAKIKDRMLHARSLRFGFLVMKPPLIHPPRTDRGEGGTP